MHTQLELTCNLAITITAGSSRRHSTSISTRQSCHAIFGLMDVSDLRDLYFKKLFYDNVLQFYRRRALIFTFPYNIVQLFNRFIMAVTLSFIIGGLYWQVRSGREQEFVWDRIGFIGTILGIGIVPLLLGEISSGKSFSCFSGISSHK